MKINPIIDNRKVRLGDVFKEHCKNARMLRIAVGYFHVSGFNILREYLGNIDKIRLIMGDETDEMTASQLRMGHEKARKITIQNNINKILSDVSDGPESDMLMELYEYIKTGKMEVRVYVKNKFHVKSYMFDIRGYSPDVAFVGSSNLSKAGLGYEGGNTELNILSYDPQTVEKLSEWYDRTWGDALPYKDELIKIIKNSVPYARLRNDLEYVTPKELFKIMAEELLDGWSEPEESEELLAEFQKIGVLNASEKIRRFDGCIVADSVGLGKTYIAMELIREAQSRGHNALVIVPKNVEQNWQRELKKYSGIMLDESRLKIITINKLSRINQSQTNDRDELSLLRDKYDFIVIDEAHRFRNDGHYIYEYSGNKNYANLKFLKKENTRYVLLTATPLNNTVKDLKNLISIFTTETKLKNTNPMLDFSHFEEYDNITRQIKKLDKKDPIYDDKRQKLISQRKPHEQGIRNILEEVIILRTRSDINERYSNEVIGGIRMSFQPIKVIPSRCKFPQVYMTLYKEVVDLLSRLKVPHMSMRSGGNPQLLGLFMTLLYKRLESSIHSFVVTLERVMETEKNLLKDTERHGWESAISNKPVYDEGLDEYGLIVPHDETMQDKEVMDSMREDIQIIREFIDEYVRPVRLDGGFIDPKLDILLDMLRLEDGKALVFTQYRDTAEYLYDHVRNIGKNVDCVSGTEDLGTDLGTYMKVKLFAPMANHYKLAPDEQEIDILIATDTLSEGVNLQDCGVVINYDIPWNPMRMVQRAGRSDRIGSTTRTTVHNILPDEEFDDLFLRLLDRVTDKISTIIDILGTENQIVTDEENVNPKTIGEAIRKMGDPGDINRYEEIGRNRMFRGIRTNEKISEIILKIQERVRKLGSIKVYKKQNAIMYSTVLARSTDRKGIFMMFKVIDTAQDEKLRNVTIFKDNNGKFHEITTDDFLTSIPMDGFEGGLLRANNMNQVLEDIEKYLENNQLKEIRKQFNPARMGTNVKPNAVQEIIMLRLDRIKSHETLHGDTSKAVKLHEILAGVVLLGPEVSILKECFGGKNVRKNAYNMPKSQFIKTVLDFCESHVINNPNYPRQRRDSDIHYEKVCWGAFV